MRKVVTPLRPDYPGIRVTYLSEDARVLVYKQRMSSIVDSLVKGVSFRTIDLLKRMVESTNSKGIKILKFLELINSKGYSHSLESKYSFLLQNQKVSVKNKKRKRRKRKK